MAKVELQNRIIKTTITLGDAGLTETREFLSSGGRYTVGVISKQPRVYMRQDFSVRESINIGGIGLATAEIELWNLTDDSATEIEAKGLFVKLEAGWEGKTGELFSGKISSVTRTKPDPTSPNIVTTLYCVSGLTKQQNQYYQESVINDSLSAVLGRLAAAIGLTLLIDSQVVGTISNMTLEGDILEILRKLSTQFNFNFYWNEQQLIVKAVLPPSQVKVSQHYSPLNGLLDIPVVTEIGVDLKVFLDPQIRPGDGFTLDSDFANFNIGSLNYVNRVRGQNLNTFSSKINSNRYQGTYQALRIYHEGSSHENTWYTSINAMGAVNFESLNQNERLDLV